MKIINKNFLKMILVLNLAACTTIQNRSKPPEIEHFNTNYETAYEDLTKMNSFAFIYKNEKYYFNSVKTYIDQGSQEYYLGYKEGKLSYIFPAKNIVLLKEIFASKQPLYKKTESIVAKLNGLNLFPAKSIPYQIQTKHTIIEDVVEDTLTFAIYGTLAVIAIPLIVGHIPEHVANAKTQNNLNAVRLGMTYQQVEALTPGRLEKKKIDQYDVEIYTSNEWNWYTNALFIFEENKLVGMVKSLTTERISNFYQKL